MQTVAARQVSLAMRKHERSLELPFQELDPKVTEADLGKAIVIKRGSNQLLYYNGDKLEAHLPRRDRPVVVPDAARHFEIVTMQRNPWWYPPAGSAWAEGAKPIPPGPGNPLGTRWMGISSPYVGIHGTPDAASIGYSASHGCIRMLIPQVEWLFQQVDVGTPVFIVAGVSSDARPGRVQRVAQLAALIGVAALLGLLIWKVAFGRTTGAAGRARQGRARARPGVHARPPRPRRAARRSPT